MSGALTKYQKAILWIGLPIFCFFGAFVTVWSLRQIYITHQLDEEFRLNGKPVMGRVIELQPQYAKGGMGWSRVVEYEKSGGEKTTLTIEFPVVGTSQTKAKAFAEAHKFVELEYLPNWSAVRKKPPYGIMDLMGFLIMFAFGLALFGITAWGLVKRKTLGL